MEANELKRELLNLVVREWIQDNLFLAQNLVEKNLTEHINQHLKIEGLSVKLDKTNGYQLILLKYGTFEKSYELKLALQISLYDEGCSESGVSGTTGYVRDLKYPQ